MFCPSGSGCSLHRGVLAGARSQVSAAHCAETRLHFVTITGDLWGNGRDGGLLEMRERCHFNRNQAQKALKHYFSTFGTKWQTNGADIFHCTGPPPCVSQAAVVTSAWPWLGEGGSGGGGAGRQLGTTLRCRGWGTPSCSQARMGMETGARDQEYVVAAHIYWDQSLAWWAEGSNMSSD